MGFPDGSDGEESASNAGDPIASLNWEDTLEKELETHSNIFAWRISWAEEPDKLRPWGRNESDTTEQLTHTRSIVIFYMT